MTVKYQIEGMHCVGCSSNLEDAINNLSEVKKANVNLISNELSVIFKQEVNHDIIFKIVIERGFKAKLIKDEELIGITRKKRNYKDLTKLLISGGLLLIILFFAMGPKIGLPSISTNPLVSLTIQLVLVLTISIIYFDTFIIGFKNLFRLKPSMASLTSLGVISAIVYGVYAYINVIIGFKTSNNEMVDRFINNVYFEAAATILVHVALGEYLEILAIRHTKSSFEELLALVPQTGFKQFDDSFIETNVKDIEIGDVIRVNPGAAIPLDGIVISGYGEVNEAAITGESMPVSKKEGDEVVAATINLSGSFLFKVTKRAEDTTVQQIIKLVQEASNSKAPLSRLADKVAGFLTPTVLLIAIITFVIWIIFGDIDLAFNMAISVLVISCPCSLGLATPIAIMSGTSKSAQKGILIKNAVAFEKMAKCDTVVFDKTGTLTYGNLHVTEVTISKDELDEIASDIYSVESQSDHPLALALTKYLTQHFKVQLCKINHFYYHPGEGISAKSEKNHYLIGNETLLKNNGIVFTPPNTIGTYIHIAKNNNYIGSFVFEDEIHNDAVAMIYHLQKLGKEVIMMTGDHKYIANKVANKVGIKTVYSSLLPSDKVDIINRLKLEGKKVVMIGDGINDAPALEAAFLGIAIGNGTKVAIASADVIIMRDSLLDIVRTFLFANKVVRSIKWNLFWAFFYNGLMIPLAAGILYYPYKIALNPMIASLSMALSGIFIIISSITLKATNFNKLIKEEQYDHGKKENHKVSKCCNRTNHRH